MIAGKLVPVSRGQFLVFADEGQVMRNALRFFGPDNDRAFACYSYWVAGDVVYVGRTKNSVQDRLCRHFFAFDACAREFPITVTWSTYRSELEMEDAEWSLIKVASDTSCRGVCNVIGV